MPAVHRDASVDRAAVNQTVRYHVAPSGNGTDITPAMTIPEPTDQTIGNDSITITNARAYEFGWVGENQRGLNNNGPGYQSVQADQFAQALRGLVNEIEDDLAAAAVAGASRAVGTPAPRCSIPTSTTFPSFGRFWWTTARRFRTCSLWWIPRRVRISAPCTQSTMTGTFRAHRSETRAC